MGNCLISRQVTTTLAALCRHAARSYFLSNIGAPGRTRTGTAFAERFSYHFGFRRRINVRGLDFVLTLASQSLRPPPSSLCTFHNGFAQRCLTSRRGFAEFDGIHTGAFAPRCSNCSSLLCLPVSPRAHECSILCRFSFYAKSMANQGCLVGEFA